MAIENNKSGGLIYNWKIFSRPCYVGEILKPGDESCYKCPEQQYSLIDPMFPTNSGAQQTCIPCEENADCHSGADLSPKYGFWRFSRQSSKIVECYSKSFCIGGQGAEKSSEESNTSIFILNEIYFNYKPI